MIANLHLARQLLDYCIKLVGTGLLVSLPIIMSRTTPPTHLDRIIQSGELVVASRNGPTTYYEGRDGYEGIEYELADSFAKTLGVKLVIKEYNEIAPLLSDIGHQVNFAAAGLTVTPSRSKYLNFTEPYMRVTQQVIYRRGMQRPENIDELAHKLLTVIADSSHVDTLHSLQQTYPNLVWQEKSDVEMIDLMEMVHNGDIDYAVIDSHVVSINQGVYPKAQVAFNISGEKHLAWAFPEQEDDSLYKAASYYLNQSDVTQLIAQLRKKYFRDTHNIDKGNALTLSKRVRERLPKWTPLFKEAAKEHDIDWLFLAAISYQESHWNPKARSTTGVKGLMMLTRATASDLGIKDRTDPKSSIFGGAKYFAQVLNRIPEDIREPDRRWMALAAYNVGYGHLKDAWGLAERMGLDPHLWQDVKQVLPLLSKPKYYKTLRHGYARGWEPVQYVENIRRFHKVLVRYNQLQQRKTLTKDKKKPQSKPINYSKLSNDRSTLL